MATFFYDRHSNENNLSQWTKHLQTEAYISDIGDIVTRNRRELESTMNNASAEQVKAINQVCGSLDAGFREVNGHLKDINSNISGLRGEINEMAAMLDWKLSMLIEEQRVTNDLLGNIATLLRIPDSQKQRVYHIEQGLKYLKNDFLEEIDSSFYIDALEGFQEAEKIERKDFITLNRIGQIYLYSKKYMDIPLAEQYFLKSAREASVEANAGGTTTSNNLNPHGYNSGQYSESPFKIAAAEAFLYASRCCYLQNKLQEAAEFSGKAYTLIPDFFEAGFEQAKYLAANSKETEAASVLETVISKDRFLSIKTLTDRDLSSKNSVLSLLGKFQQTSIRNAKDELNKCKNIMREDSNAKKIIQEIESHISQNTFLSVMKALDMLNAKYALPYLQYFNNGYDNSITSKYVSSSQGLLAFLIAENNSVTELEKLKKECLKANVEESVLYGGGAGAVFGFLVGFYNGCSIKKFSMDWGSMFLTLLVIAGIGAFIGYLIGNGKTIKIEQKSY